MKNNGKQAFEVLGENISVWVSFYENQNHRRPPETNSKLLGTLILSGDHFWETKNRRRPPETNPKLLGIKQRRTADELEVSGIGEIIVVGHQAKRQQLLSPDCLQARRAQAWQRKRGQQSPFDGARQLQFIAQPARRKDRAGRVQLSLVFIEFTQVPN